MAKFNPYSMNGGTVLGIAGDDYCLLASDTRLCEEESYNILTRHHPHLYQINKKSVIAATGFQGDTITMVKTLKAKAQMYNFNHGKEMSTNALAHLLSVTLYSHRFFPWYVSNIVGGLDDQGRGALYSYDSIGSFEREQYRASGSAGKIVQSFLDNQLRRHNQVGCEPRKVSASEAVDLVKDIFISAAERDIHCGDELVINVITRGGIEEHRFDLRKD